MSIEALQEYTRISKYARYNESKQRREIWAEQTTRVFNMHREKYAEFESELKNSIIFAEDLVKRKRVLGSQRALQYGGLPIMLKNEKLYNCTASYCDRPRFFQEAMWLSLCGCGVGFSVQKHHIDKLPSVKIPTGEKVVYQIPDSIEGWSDAVGILMSTYFTKHQPFPEYAGKVVEFDMSLIRKKGSIIKSSGAKAPGPKPLLNALEQTRKLLDDLFTMEPGKRKHNGDTLKLNPIDAYDIVMYSVDAVVSGGIRRSATITLFSPEDQEMRNAKTGNWRHTHPQRGRSNNSVVLLRSTTSIDQFKEYIQAIKEYGEPGFVFVDDLESLFNPCAEINMYAYNEAGKSGWSFCNLCEINGKKAKTKEEFFEMCRGAAIIGTLQAGYDSFPYLGKVTEDIVKREALLGISITGMMDSPEVTFDPAIQREGARIIKEENAKIAKIIGIRQAARTTCIKPAGTTSCMLGTASGIHPHHAKRYIRRVQVNKLESPLGFFRKYNPRAIEESVWSPNKTDDVISFLCEVPRNARTKVDTSALELLEMVKTTQENWINEGRNLELCTKPWLQHNVSNTVHILEPEWDGVISFIYENRQYFNGISFLPEGCDKDYPQAPFTTIYTPEEILKEYGEGAIMASGLIVDGLKEWKNNLWAACDMLLGRNGEPKDKYQIDWLRRGKQFADRYFEGNLKKMTYCLKDVNNFKLWLDLKREYQDVPWEEFHEEVDNTKLEQAAACAGGACELKRF